MKTRKQLQQTWTISLNSETKLPLIIGWGFTAWTVFLMLLQRTPLSKKRREAHSLKLSSMQTQEQQSSKLSFWSQIKPVYPKIVYKMIYLRALSFILEVFWKLMPAGCSWGLIYDELNFKNPSVLNAHCDRRTFRTLFYYQKWVCPLVH